MIHIRPDAGNKEVHPIRGTEREVTCRPKITGPLRAMFNKIVKYKSYHYHISYHCSVYLCDYVSKVLQEADHISGSYIKKLEWTKVRGPENV